MKTAISLPDDLFRAGDALAKEMKLSRSALYARALERYIARQRADEITEQLNAVYATESSELDGAILLAQLEILEREKW